MSTIAKYPTPIFNTPELSFKKDHRGFLTEIETIALPGTEFTCIQPFSDTIVQVTTPAYPSSIPLYVDQRFLTTGVPAEKKLPPSSSILPWLQNSLGTRYFWGGNWKDGIPEMLQLYPSLEPSDDSLCRGLDCSGLLYQATLGFTPRNTSDLIHFGQELPPYTPLKPLDLIVWKGHVIIALSSHTLIESRAGKGVVLSDLKTRLAEINHPYFFRRWHPDF